MGTTTWMTTTMIVALVVMVVVASRGDKCLVDVLAGGWNFIIT